MTIQKIIEKLKEQTNSETFLRFLVNDGDFDVAIEPMSISEKIILRGRKMNGHEIINVFEKYPSNKRNAEPEIWIQILGKTAAKTQESFRLYSKYSQDE
jgi:hypothetical protein